ncbi:MAG: hypothetical protein Q7R41_00255, partial [Phycisphaerales bacterium]|nr:hypothetical protein [Phycisphaerales bacterium]
MHYCGLDIAGASSYVYAANEAGNQTAWIYEVLVNRRGQSLPYERPYSVHRRSTRKLISSDIWSSSG